MNILQINATDDTVGGASRIACDLYSRLKRENGSKMIVGKKTQDNNDVRQIPKTFLQKALSYGLANDVSYFKTDFILDTNEFKEADVIQCHNLNGWYFDLGTLQKMSQAKPVVWTLHDMWAITPHCAHAYDGPQNDGFYACRSMKDYPSMPWNNDKRLCDIKRKAYDDSDFTVVVPSKWLFDKGKKSVLGTKDIRLIYNGIDTSIFKRADRAQARAELGLPMDKKLILFAANGGLENEFKGGNHVRELIEMNKDDASVAFICLGEEVDGETGNMITRKKTSSKEKMAQYLNACDMLIFPSAAENFPLITLEAMACGMPIVSFDVGGVSEAIRHLQNGFVTKEASTKELQEGIEYILSLDQEKAKAMSDRSVRDVQERFSIDRMAKEYVLLYNEVISKKK